VKVNLRNGKKETHKERGLRLSKEKLAQADIVNSRKKVDAAVHNESLKRMLSAEAAELDKFACLQGDAFYFVNGVDMRLKKRR
jgi:3-methyladenine DNA glycosylase Tag